MTDSLALKAEPLSREAFAPFGDVIDINSRTGEPINEGKALRYRDLANLDVMAEDGRPALGWVRAQPQDMPLRVRRLLSHALSSQAFIPLGPTPFLVVVAPPGGGVETEAVRAFISNGHQGVNYARGVWHHPLVALHAVSDFLLVDRAGPGDAFAEYVLRDSEIVINL